MNRVFADTVRSDRSETLVAGFNPHPGRSAAVGEVHSRPHPLLPAPRTLVQLAFATEGGAVVDTAVVAQLCRKENLSPPERTARHRTFMLKKGNLHWERHSEFSTYLWDAPPLGVNDWKTGSPFDTGFNPPGTVMSGVRLEILALEGNEPLPPLDIDPESICHALVEDGNAEILTDFRQDADGLTRLFMIDRGLNESRRGALAQRLIEIETYRVFCMLGLSLAQSLSSQLRRLEADVAQLTNEIRQGGRHDSERLLGRLTDLAAELEAQAASSLFRFGASRAYYEIVLERLDALRETPIDGAASWSQFLARRVAPAMRTCRSVEERQANLSRKVSRTTQLLRTWVDVEVERQNRDLLASMNDRARQQLRLQQTVEGLSVAAISYYVIGLIGYLLEGLPLFFGTGLPKSAVGLAVPVIVLVIWIFVRRIQKGHADIGSRGIA
ncbi:DUF3422 family protein [Aliihoeflea sp. 2WW]|uniref:DUF3422 family protein n=1 Tax=Aliihoeflea sp. 2WW TaxID=1381123 RepID=UPI00046782ED|nr:DUF3422 family protein [Aliihoeflea sp. 2WW]